MRCGALEGEGFLTLHSSCSQVSLHVAARSFPSPEVAGLVMGRYLHNQEMALELLTQNGGAQARRAL